MTLAVALTAGGAAALATPLPDTAAALLSRAGGATVLLAAAALLLLGAAWAEPGRRLSRGFLAGLASLAGLLLLIESAGPLWWRLGAPELWQRFPDEEGRLRQSGGLTCSPAAGAMLLHRHGVRASEGELAYLASTSLFGTDAHALARALGRKVGPLGWSAAARRADYEAVLSRGGQFVAHVRGSYLGHAVLVERADADGVELVDPLDGSARRMTRAAFEEAWDGTAVEVVGRPD